MPQSESQAPADIGRRVCAAMVEAGVSLALYLPDSVMTAFTTVLEAEPTIRTVVCSREDEGMAIAAGASLAGGLPVVLMEGSGVGFGGLILARARVQRSGFLVMASHSPALGERFDYHAASSVVGAGVLGGLGIPYVIPTSQDDLVTAVRRGLETVVGLRTVVGILIPPYVAA